MSTAGDLAGSAGQTSQGPAGYAVGIDLGTTYSAAALYRAGKAEMVPLGNRSASIPSLVFLREDGTILTGEAAERRGLAEPARLARQFKRRVGDAAPVVLGRTPYSADRLMAQLLRSVIDAVQEREGSAPAQMALTHPANWGPYKTDLVRQSAELAGVRNATLVTEPMAAAIHYSATERLEVGGLVAVYDLGGGTFDAAILRRTDTSFEALGEPEGIERLGGIDFDEAIFSHVAAVLDGKLDELDPTDLQVRTAMARLRAECTNAKEALSTDSDTTIPVVLPDLQLDVRITRSEFESMIRPTIDETISALRRAIARAKIQPAELATVLLIGGSSRIPLIGELVSGELGRPVSVNTHPKHAVALGAAYLAGMSLEAAAPRQAASSGSASAPAAAALPPAAAAAPAAGAAAAAPRPVPVEREAPAAQPEPAEPEPVGLPLPVHAPAHAGSTMADLVSARTNGVHHSPTPVAVHPPAATAPRYEPELRAAMASLPTMQAVAPVRPAVDHPYVPTVVSEPDWAARPVPPRGARAGSAGAVRLGVTIAVATVMAVLGGFAGMKLAERSSGSGTATASTTDGSAVTTGTAGSTNTTGETQTTDHTQTTDATNGGRCTSEEGRCVFIDDIRLDGDRYVVRYETVGYTPRIVGEDPEAVPGDHHIHFFFDTTAPHDAGGNSPNPGRWELWDLNRGKGRMAFDRFTTADAGTATRLCAAVATEAHGVAHDAEATGNCVDLPTS